MDKQSIAQHSQTGKPVTVVPIQVLVDVKNKIHDMISRRAYELFENRSYVHGQEFDDWLCAESELLYPCRHEMKESSEALTLRVELPGPFSPDQLKFSIEPRRLIVSGEKDIDVMCGDSEGTHAETKQRHIFRVHDLPRDVDAARTTATLKGEVLEIVMPKIAAVLKYDKASAAR